MKDRDTSYEVVVRSNDGNGFVEISSSRLFYVRISKQDLFNILTFCAVYSIDGGTLHFSEI